MSETKQFPITVALTLASEGIGLGDKFDVIHEAITWVLGREVWTHELAERAPWKRAGELVCLALPDLADFAWKLRKTPKDYAQILEATTAFIGSKVVDLPKGSDERTESPLASIARIAPDKPVITIVVK